ncbi:MAG: DUF1624 domain-containing protein [Bosea sp. (in: a-proteobacteria)]
MSSTMSPAGTEAPAPVSSRWPVLDVARGVALCAMFVFHFMWDLSLFGLVHPDTPAEPAWVWFARCIATSFLFLSGISLTFAAANGLNRTKFAKRLGLLVAAAIAVTIGTWFGIGEGYVFFGILHHMAFASLVGLLFLQLPNALVAIAALTSFALPFVFTHYVFDHPALLWLGLYVSPPNTVDYVPVFPWFGWFLAGMLAGRWLLANPGALSRWQPSNGIQKALAFGGSHSLAVYLLHQPVFFALLYGFVTVTGFFMRAGPA